jgi:hypothetical protein
MVKFTKLTPSIFASFAVKRQNHGDAIEPVHLYAGKQLIKGTLSPTKWD